jgi:hypothetical protein
MDGGNRPRSPRVWTRDNSEDFEGPVPSSFPSQPNISYISTTRELDKPQMHSWTAQGATRRLDRPGMTVCSFISYRAHGVPPTTGLKFTLLTFSSTLELEDMVVVVLQFTQSTLDFTLLHTILGSTNSGVLTRTVTKVISALQPMDCQKYTHGPHTKNYKKRRWIVSRSFDGRKIATYLDVPGVVLWQVLLNHLLGNVTLLSSPEVRRLVERVNDLEPVRVLLGELVPSFSQHWSQTKD